MSIRSSNDNFDLKVMTAEHIDRHCLETTYCFLHQKLRVYMYSTIDWQRDDIECAIGSFVETMNPSLRELLSGGKGDFLTNHQTFETELSGAVSALEKMLNM